MAKSTGPRTQFPFYKVHVYDLAKLAWVDARKFAFDSLDDAKAFIKRDLPGREARILVVTAKGREVYVPRDTRDN